MVEENNDFRLVVEREIAEQSTEIEFKAPSVMPHGGKYTESQLTEAITGRGFPLFPLIRALLEKKSDRLERITLAGFENHPPVLTCAFDTKIAGVERFWMSIWPQTDGTVEIALTAMSKNKKEPAYGVGNVEEMTRQKLLSEMRRILTVPNIKMEIERRQTEAKRIEKLRLKN